MTDSGHEKPPVTSDDVHLKSDNGGVRKRTVGSRHHKLDHQELSVAHFPEDVQDIIAEFDVDNSGAVSVDEMVAAARLFRNYRNIYKRLGVVLIILLTILCVIFGVMGGIVYAVVHITRTTGANGAELLLYVQGIARVPRESSLYGSVVHIVTAAGTVTLDGTALSFSEDVAPVFRESGFAVSSDGRKLLGLYELAALFNLIRKVDGLDQNATLPKFPESFYTKYKVWYECNVKGSNKCSTNLVDATHVKTIYGVQMLPVYAESWVAPGLGREEYTMPSRDDKFKLVNVINENNGTKLVRAFQTLLRAQDGDMTKNYFCRKEDAKSGPTLTSDDVVARYTGLKPIFDFENEASPTIECREFIVKVVNDPATTWYMYDRLDAATNSYTVRRLITRSDTGTVTFDFAGGFQALSTAQLDTLKAQGFFNLVDVTDKNKCDNTTFSSTKEIHAAYPFPTVLSDEEKAQSEMNALLGENTFDGADSGFLAESFAKMSKPRFETIENCTPEKRLANADIDQGCANGTVPWTRVIEIPAQTQVLKDVLTSGTARRRALQDEIDVSGTDFTSMGDIDLDDSEGASRSLLQYKYCKDPIPVPIPLPVPTALGKGELKLKFTLPTACRVELIASAEAVGLLKASGTIYLDYDSATFSAVEAGGCLAITAGCSEDICGETMKKYVTLGEAKLCIGAGIDTYPYPSCKRVYASARLQISVGSEALGGTATVWATAAYYFQPSLSCVNAEITRSVGVMVTTAKNSWYAKSQCRQFDFMIPYFEKLDAIVGYTDPAVKTRIEGYIFSSWNWWQRLVEYGDCRAPFQQALDHKNTLTLVKKRNLLEVKFGGSVKACLFWACKTIYDGTIYSMSIPIDRSDV